MQDRPNLCWAAVWFGLALLARLGGLAETTPRGRMESWSAAGFCLLLCCWFLLQHWLDKRKGPAPPADHPLECGWGREWPQRTENGARPDITGAYAHVFTKVGRFAIACFIVTLGFMAFGALISARHGEPYWQGSLFGLFLGGWIPLVIGVGALVLKWVVRG